MVYTTEFMYKLKQSRENSEKIHNKLSKARDTTELYNAMSSFTPERTRLAVYDVES